MPVRTAVITTSKPSAARITGYAALVKAVRQELDELDFFIRRRTAESYWRVGKFTHEHLLGEKERSEHGSAFFEQFAQDVERDASTLSRCLQFYRAYPILAAPQELTWEHYKSLITIKDEKERKKLEQLIVRNDWNTKEFRDYLRLRHALEAAQDEDNPVAQLKLTRGRLNVYKVVAPGVRVGANGRSPLLIDYGFGVLRAFSQGEQKGFQDGDLIERSSGSYVTTDIDDALRYTYKAYVERVVDGDTLLVLIEGGGGNLVRERLRLRGINCPEAASGEGKRAKRFVERKLGACAFIIIRTYKEKVDPHARYITDVFYLPEAGDAAQAAAQGYFLNQQLLDERLGVAYP